MPVISGSIPNLVNGVSQQPFALRLASQAEEQINGYSSIVDGLAKRPPTLHSAKLQADLTDNSYLHIINRDANERYVVVTGEGDLKVFDLAGNAQTVSFPDGKDYLASTDLSMITIADYTFVVNKSMSVAMAEETAPERPPEGMVFVRQGNYQTTYRVFVDETKVAEYTTDKLEASTIATDHIAAQLQQQFAENADFNVSRSGSTLHIYRKDSGSFKLRTEDGIADAGMVAITGSVQSFTSLPAKAISGYMAEVTGAQGNQYDNFYVQYQGSNMDGVWQEIAKPGRKVALDAATMPHVLVREADGSFTFRKAEWEKCESGDEDTAPEPSFVGGKISDIFFYRNRLGFISDENVVFSRSADFFNFWRSSATGLLDTDPIDVAVSHVKVSLLRHAIPFNETLILFSDRTQFVLGAGDILTPDTVSIAQATEFDASASCRPVGAGSFLYFTTSRGGFSSVREYYVTGDANNKDANDVTAHVPQYIRGGIAKLSASTTEDIIVALSDTCRNEIYTYKYFYTGQEKAQSSWSRWTFPEQDKILNCDFIDNSLWLLIKRPDGLYLEQMKIEADRRAGALPFDIHLDRRVSEQQCLDISYDPASRKSTIKLPYEEDGKLQFVTVGDGGPRPKGYLIDPERPSADAVRVPGDYRGVSFCVGRVYELRYVFSPLMIRDNAPGGGQIANTEGRLQIRRVLVNYNRSGYFRIEVTPYRRSTYTYVFSGRVIGSGKNVWGEPVVDTGSFKFPVMSNNMQVKIEVINDTPLPTHLLNADWEALYSVRTQRIA
ncbi:hypothetical protein [Martelella mangrovi]|uniref:Tail tubular protein B n=1 Tax=Martelella mangrovi TaxID=1397477 RepID=A0ABV2IDX8_9HYPH